MNCLSSVLVLELDNMSLLDNNMWCLDIIYAIEYMNSDLDEHI